MSENVQGYLIDAEKRTVEPVMFGANGIDDIRKLVKCKRFTLCARLQRNGTSGAADTVYASDDYLDERESLDHWFQVDADRDPPSSHPVPGNGLVHGTDENGDPCDVMIPIEEVRARVAFGIRFGRPNLVTEENRADGLTVIGVTPGMVIIDEGDAQ